jgi:serine/threonine protein kinase
MDRPPLQKLRPQTCQKFKDISRYSSTGTLIGTGAYGEVYLVKDKSEAGDVKAVRKDILFSEPTVGLHRNFVDETSLLSSIDLPTVVNLQNVELLQDRAVLYQNYGGRSLSEFHFDEIEAKPIIFSLITTVFSLASRGILHGDLKPENVLYNEETQKICLIDFGHAHQGLPPIKEIPLILEDYGGTETFFSPERKARKLVSVASEVYAIGLIWYQLISGQPVDQNGKQVVELENLGEVSDETYEIIQAMLEKDLEDRITMRNLINSNYFSDYTEEEKEVIRGFGWFEDSCYVDSLLMILLFSCDNFWHRGMLDANVLINQPLKCEQQKQDITDPKEANRYRREVQDQLKAEFEALIEVQESDDEDQDEEDIQRTTCTLFRKLVARCLPSTRVRGKFVMYGAPEFYAKLTDIFPEISLEVTTYNVLTQERRLEANFKSWIPVNQYLVAPPTPDEVLAGAGGRWTVDWDAIDLPVLVFANIDSPRFSILDAPGDERGDVNGEPWAATKIRGFGPTILGGRYTLIGVITLQGVKPNRTGGAHYVSYFRADDGKWYYYNDLRRGKATSINTLPRIGVWEEAALSMPAMYFYAKTENVPVSLEENKVFLGSFLKPTEALNLRYHPVRKLESKIFDARNDRVVDLLVLCETYHSNWETYFLAVKIIDVLLSINKDFIGYENKLSVVAFLLAAKIYNPPTKKIYNLLVEWAGVSAEKLLKLEAKMYRELCFNVNFSTVYDYFKILSGTSAQLLRLRVLIRTELIYEMTDRKLALTVTRERLTKEQQALYNKEYSEEVEALKLKISP